MKKTFNTIKADVEAKAARYKLQWMLLKRFSKQLWADPLKLSEEEDQYLEFKKTLERFNRVPTIKELVVFFEKLPTCFRTYNVEEYITAVEEGNNDEKYRELLSSLEDYYIISSSDCDRIGENISRGMRDEIKDELEDAIKEVLKEAASALHDRLLDSIGGTYDISDDLCAYTESPEHMV